MNLLVTLCTHQLWILVVSEWLHNTSKIYLPCTAGFSLTYTAECSFNKWMIWLLSFCILYKMQVPSIEIFSNDEEKIWVVNIHTLSCIYTYVYAYIRIILLSLFLLKYIIFNFNTVINIGAHLRPYQKNSKKLILL